MEKEAGADREKILDSMTVWLQKDKPYKRYRARRTVKDGDLW